MPAFPGTVAVDDTRVKRAPRHESREARRQFPAQTAQEEPERRQKGTERHAQQSRLSRAAQESTLPWAGRGPARRDGSPGHHP
eukprot:7280494-Alexandrium_andersonii.AAC.1